MRTLVIHPYDPTTLFLSEVYSDKDWDVETVYSGRKRLKNLIKSYDRIIMMGHGCEYGLFEHEKLIIDDSFRPRLAHKQCVFIWCNADQFVKRNKLTGFYTGMIISDSEEVLKYNIKAIKSTLDESNNKFAEALRVSIDSDNILESMLINYTGENPIIEFNCQNLFCNK